MDISFWDDLAPMLAFARQDLAGRAMPSAREAAPQSSVLREFEEFFRRFERQITGYLCRMLRDEQMARDLSQETFIQAWQHFAQIKDSAAARAWLHRVATNLALRVLQQRRAYPVQEMQDDVPGASDPGRRIVERDRVREVLARLTPKQQSVLLLYELQGFGCEEIGQIMGMSRDAVKQALWRGREQFRQHYLREDEA